MKDTALTEIPNDTGVANISILGYGIQIFLQNKSLYVDLKCFSDSDNWDTPVREFGDIESLDGLEYLVQTSTDVTVATLVPIEAVIARCRENGKLRAAQALDMLDTRLIVFSTVKTVLAVKES